jgi:hypothetical protein
MGTESGHSDHARSHGRRGGAFADSVDDSRRLVPYDAGGFGCIGIEALACHDLGEVQAGGLHADADLARSGFRIGGASDLQDFGAAGLRDPYRSHAFVPRRIGALLGAFDARP